MTIARVPVDPARSPVIALAFVEDALAVASYAEACGFTEDAERMRAWARELRERIPATRRWVG